jgi:RimJ/RimL family protein N-acetyltransferase
MEIRTARLHLREFVAEDWPAVLAYQSKSEYLRYYPWEARRPEDVQTFVRRFLNWQLEQPRTKYQLAIVHSAEKSLIGNCGVRLAQADSPEGELGYEIDPRYWGFGYATEAGRAMLAFGFERGLHRIWATCLADNAGSKRVLEKLGMQCEGRLRENRWFKGRWWDTLLYSLLEQEWPAGSF